MMPLLEARGLRVSYGPSPALVGVDLVVPEGVVVGVLGPNGAGKSTLLRSIAGLVRPAGGMILHRGERVDGMAAHEIARRGICLIPEGRGILPSLTVADNLKLALPSEEASLGQVFERFGVLRERSQQQAGTLSGGEQQMVAMGRALMSRPKLMLMDEPSMGLAPILVERSFEIIKQVHEAGVAVLVVEQNANVSLAIADRGYVLQTGRIVLADLRFHDLLELPGIVDILECPVCIRNEEGIVDMSQLLIGDYVRHNAFGGIGENNEGGGWNKGHGGYQGWFRYLNRGRWGGTGNQ